MSTGPITHGGRAAHAHEHAGLRDATGPVQQAYLALRTIFTVAPLLAGADKFLNALTTWEQYLAPQIPSLIGVTPELFMRGVGIIEIAAGVLVAVAPRIGAYVVMAWLLAIIGNLAILGGHWDIALRDLGLAAGAFALARLSHEIHRDHARSR